MLERPETVAAGLQAVREVDATLLRHLDLSGTSPTDDDLQSVVARCPQLESVHVDGGSLTEASLIALSKLSSLQCLQWKFPPIREHGLRHVAAITSLRTLRLQKVALTSAQLAPLSQLTGLTDLSLECDAPFTGDNPLPLTGAACTHLAKLPLTRLCFKFCLVFNGFSQLAPLRLRSLKLAHCPDIDGRALKLIVAEWPGLTDLDLKACSEKWSTADFLCLCDLKAISRLSLRQLQLNLDWSVFSALAQLLCLTDLTLTGLAGPSTGLAQIKHLSLTQLSLRTDGEADYELLNLSQNCARLPSKRAQPTQRCLAFVK